MTPALTHGLQILIIASGMECLQARMCLSSLQCTVCSGRLFKPAASEAAAARAWPGKPESAWMGRPLMTVGYAVITVSLGHACDPACD